MTFASIPNPVSHIIFDSNNETAQLGTVTPGRNTVIESIQLFFYKQGVLNPASLRAYITVSGTPYYTESVLLSLVDGNQIGRMKLNFTIKPNLINAIAYPFGIELSNYTPTVSENFSTDQYFSLLRDYPVKMAYSTPTAKYNSAIAFHLIESV